MQANSCIIFASYRCEMPEATSRRQAETDPIPPNAEASFMKAHKGQTRWNSARMGFLIVLYRSTAALD
jgi:hypothetical protein